MHREYSQDDLLSVPEIAQMLHVSPKTINRLIGYGRGELPAVMVGSRWKVRMRDLKEYLQKGGGTFSDDQAFELSVPDRLQENNNKDDMLSLDLQKKRLELADTALEVATKMINSLHPDVSAETRVALIRETILVFLETTSLQELEQAILKIPPAYAEQ
ncbi:MAG: helix-turn-helix domain-containing protein [Ktedonobacteraceae bacterium]|nr:helix-turn-helix domain-containing protein [Ktedonobacteraceae bacterium]MBV9615509.1 helix-turn-helix domain-containing protein [Ktedonobacteraceae bacterium]